MRQFIAEEAQRLKVKARIGLTGATNTGKTYTALTIAGGLLLSEGYVTPDGQPDWSKVAVIDTERRRALFYANNGRFGKFKHINFEPPYDPESYIEAVKYAESIGTKVCIIDSLSHAWNGTGGVLDIVNEKTLQSRSKNTFTEGWGGKDGGTSLQNKMVDQIMSCDMHTICTFRQKMEYVQERDENGRTQIRKLGTKPIQRDDLEYEFDITLRLNNDHTAEIIKNTVDFLGKNSETLPIISEEFGTLLGDYLSKGEDPSISEKNLKDSRINEIKALGSKYPVLLDYFKGKYPNRKLTDLSNKELNELLFELKGMI